MLAVTVMTQRWIMPESNRLAPPYGPNVGTTDGKCKHPLSIILITIWPGFRVSDYVQKLPRTQGRSKIGVPEGLRIFMALPVTKQAEGNGYNHKGSKQKK